MAKIKGCKLIYCDSMIEVLFDLVRIELDNSTFNNTKIDMIDNNNMLILNNIDDILEYNFKDYIFVGVDCEYYGFNSEIEVKSFHLLNSEEEPFFIRVIKSNEPLENTIEYTESILGVFSVVWTESNKYDESTSSITQGLDISSWDLDSADLISINSLNIGESHIVYDGSQRIMFTKIN